jgi:exonuclease SbcC
MIELESALRSAARVMYITKVELENIKNYKADAFEFDPGVTVISGPNGAGKTTILEAIAWALFDYLPYKKDDFLRRGAKRGSVRVSFVSSLDGREYTIYRDTGTGYYVYDPVTKLRVAEQKNQIGAWIKQHLGVEASTDLKSLFTSAIGVPQGTFTASFAEQPAKRKVEFDKVLRVEDYNRSAEDLRPLVRLIESKLADLREQMARAEAEISSLDDLLSERKRCQAECTRLKHELPQRKRRRDAIRQELEHLDKLRGDIEKKQAELIALASQIEQTERRLDSTKREVERARKAARATAAAAAGFEIYNQAEAQLKQLEKQMAERDQLNALWAEKRSKLIRIEASSEGLREKLRQVEQDKKELELLKPKLAEQERLEARRSELQASVGEMKVLEESAEAARRELNLLREEYKRVSKQVEEAEQVKGLAEQAPSLEESRRALEAELSKSRVERERLIERRREVSRVRNEIDKLRGEIKTIEKEMAKGLAVKELASELPKLEAEHERMVREAAKLRASIDRDERTLAQIKGGLCPLLNERCRNMKEGQTLDQYFKVQLTNEREVLDRLERQREDVHRKILQARDAMRACSVLENQKIEHARRCQELEIKLKDEAKLEKEIAEISVSEDMVRLLSSRLDQLERELKKAQEAQLKYERLGPLRERLRQLEVEGAQKRSNLDNLNERIIGLARLCEELKGIEKQLAELDDPRGRFRSLSMSVSAEGELLDRLREAEVQVQALGSDMKKLEDELARFVGLDERLLRERERRAASEKDYRTYIENLPIARTLSERESERAEIEKALANDRHRWEALDNSLKQLQAVYSQQRHTEAKRELEEAIGLVARLESELSSLEQKLAQINSEVERLSEVKMRLAELDSKRARLEKLLALSEFIRDLLKKAGPFITEAHLQSISIEANQLYREITGNPMVTLRWDAGYEIVLEEGGHDRPFASLSGGEQMAAALAVRLALLKELSDMRVAFFDEPTTNMDEERRRNLAQQIGRIRDFDQLFVISHDDAFEGFTDQVISVGEGAGEGL